MIVRPKERIEDRYGSVTDLTLFPIYQSREDYREEFGVDAPWDPSQPKKHWFDPEPEKHAKKRTLPGVGVFWEYPYSLLVDENGVQYPELVPLLVPDKLVRVVNISEGKANEPQLQADGRVGTTPPFAPPVPFPLRALRPNERLERGFGGVVRVVNTDIPPEASLDEIMALLRKIAADIESLKR